MGFVRLSGAVRTPCPVCPSLGPSFGDVLVTLELLVKPSLSRAICTFPHIRVRLFGEPRQRVFALQNVTLAPCDSPGWFTRSSRYLLSFKKKMAARHNSPHLRDESWRVSALLLRGRTFSSERWARLAPRHGPYFTPPPLSLAVCEKAFIPLSGTPPAFIEHHAVRERNEIVFILNNRYRRG